MKPGLLFLCQTLPYPPDGGVAIRSYHVLRILSERFEVHALCFTRKAVLRDRERSLRVLSEICSVEAFEIEQESSWLRFGRDHLQSVISGRVYTTRVYENQAFRERLRELIRSQRFALAHLDSLDLSGYLPELAGLPVVCVHHNVESRLLARRSRMETRRLRRWYVAHQARLMAREEATHCPKVSLNVLCSVPDQLLLLSIAPRSRTTVVPNGVDVRSFAPTVTEQSGIVFVGGMTWFPNRDAMEYFTASILPHIRRAEVGAAVKWVGRASREAVSSYAARGVQLTGYVDDIRSHVHEAACFVVPLRVGGGTRLKILDAWAMGKAVVSTTIGCEGLDARDGKNILIRDDPASFASAVVDVLRDPALRAHLGSGARSTAEAVYSWEVIGGRMLAAYESLLNAGGAA